MAIPIPIIDGVFNVGMKLIDRFFPDAAAADAAKLELLKMQQAGELAHLAADTDLAKGQLEINKVEAASQSLLVGGGRPAVIWICGFALGYAAILEPVGRFVAMVGFGYTGAFPVIDTDITLQVLFGLLGLGAYRTAERIKGVIPPQK
jgi:hypothetical protein